MNVDVTIRKAIAQLEAERAAIDARLSALRGGLGSGKRAGGGAAATTRARKQSRRRMTAAQKRAVSARMRKYWADRRKAKAEK